MLANPWVGRGLGVGSEVLRIAGKTADGGIVEGGKEALGAPVRLGASYAGAKGGAVLGGMIGGPPGAAIGGVVGGVGGYIAGDEVVDRIRNADAQSYAERFGVDFDPATAGSLKKGALYTAGALSEVPGLLIGSAYPDQQPLSQTQIRQGADRTVEASQLVGTPVAPFPADGENQIAALQSKLAAAQKAADEARRNAPIAFAGRAGGPESIPQPDPQSAERLRASSEAVANTQSQLQALLVAREAASRPPVAVAPAAAEAPAEAAPAPTAPPSLERYTPPSADGFTQAPVAGRVDGNQNFAQNPAAGQIFRVVGPDGRVTYTDRPGAGEQRPLSPQDQQARQQFLDRTPGMLGMLQAPADQGGPVAGQQQVTQMSIGQSPSDPRAQTMRQGQEQQDAGQRQLQAMLNQARGDRLGVAQGAQGRLGKLYDAFNDQIAQGRRRTAAVIGEQIRAELGVLGQTASGQLIDPRTPDRTADMLRAQTDAEQAQASAGLLGEQTQRAGQENQNARRLEFLRSIIFDPAASDADKQAAQSEFQSRAGGAQQQAEGRVVQIPDPNDSLKMIPALLPPGATQAIPITLPQTPENPIVGQIEMAGKTYNVRQDGTLELAQ